MSGGAGGPRPEPRPELRPWRVLGRRVLHHDRWLKLRAETVETGDGAVLDPYYVLDYPEWANVVALTPDDRLVMVRHYRHGIGEMVLELPGGMADPADPSPEAAARRELLEETGYDGETFRHVCSLPANPAIQGNRIHTFLATGARPVAAHAREAGEEMAVELVPVREVVAGLAEGLVGQAMHVGPILLALRLAGRLRLDLGTAT